MHDPQPAAGQGKAPGDAKRTVALPETAFPLIIDPQASALPHAGAGPASREGLAQLTGAARAVVETPYWWARVFNCREIPGLPRPLAAENEGPEVLAQTAAAR